MVEDGRPDKSPETLGKRFRRGRNLMGVAGFLLMLAPLGDFYVLHYDEDSALAGTRTGVVVTAWDISVPVALMTTAGGLLAAGLFVWSMAQRGADKRRSVPSTAIAFSAALAGLAFLALLFLESPDSPDPRVYWDYFTPRWASPLLAIAVVAGNAMMWRAMPPPTETSSSQPRKRASKACPDCAEDVLPDARVCKHCGYRFAQPPPHDHA